MSLENCRKVKDARMAGMKRGGIEDKAKSLWEAYRHGKDFGFFFFFLRKKQNDEMVLSGEP